MPNAGARRDIAGPPPRCGDVVARRPGGTIRSWEKWLAVEAGTAGLRGSDDGQARTLSRGEGLTWGWGDQNALRPLAGRCAIMRAAVYWIARATAYSAMPSSRSHLMSAKLSM